LKKILFHTNQLSLRGTEVALFDYAFYNQKMFGNLSIIVTPKAASHEDSVIKKFQKYFDVIFYKDINELKVIAKHQQADIFYALKAGNNDGVVIDGLKNCIHAVFRFYEPHGDVYAYVSKWLSNTMSNGKNPYVPHMINLPNISGDLRKDLGIPNSATVFGRYGGTDTFDIWFARQAVYKIAARYPDKYFLFMNTDNFILDSAYSKSKFRNQLLGSLFYPRKKFRNVIFLDGNADPEYKVRFINTCDAMLHAREQGESFGIACGEFSVLGKRIITCDADFIPERNHIEILGKDGLYYRSYSDLYQVLADFDPNKMKQISSPYSIDYNPESVMLRFKKIFIDD